MYTKRLFRRFLMLSLLALGAAAPATASVVIGTTRVIYDAAEPEAVVKLVNDGSRPALTQVWIDAGDARAEPSAVDVPFTLTPPVARIDAGKAQTLRIFHTGEPLPSDRESAFWLNVLEIPPKPGADAGPNTLQLAFRSRIKLFYRPAGLPGNAQDAPASVTWKLTVHNGRPALEATNPTAFHVSFSSVKVGGVERVTGSVQSGMVRPGEWHVFELGGEAPATGGTLAVTVRYAAINDYGASVEGEAPVAPAIAPPVASASPSDSRSPARE